MDMSREIFISNGFAFDVFSILTYSSVNAEKCFNETPSLWTYVPVGNVVGVNFIIDDSLQTSGDDFSLVSIIFTISSVTTIRLIETMFASSIVCFS